VRHYGKAQLWKREGRGGCRCGNSAGQAAVFLSKTAARLYMLVRYPVSCRRPVALSHSSIEEKICCGCAVYKYHTTPSSTSHPPPIPPNPQQQHTIRLHYQTEIVGLAGDTNLERITWRDKVERQYSGGSRTIRATCSSWRELHANGMAKDCLARQKGHSHRRDLDGTTGRLACRSTVLLHARNKPSGVFAWALFAEKVKSVASASGRSISSAIVQRYLAET